MINQNLRNKELKTKLTIHIQFDGCRYRNGNVIIRGLENKNDRIELFPCHFNFDVFLFIQIVLT